MNIYLLIVIKIKTLFELFSPHTHPSENLDN